MPMFLQTPMETKRLVLLDETLRDGQQQPFVAFTKQQMIDLALAINNLNLPDSKHKPIYNIDIMPSMHPIHEEAARYLLDQGVPITLATIMKRCAIEATKQIGSDIITISSLSDELMQVKGIDKERNIVSTLRELSRAKGIGANVGLAGEDSARADLGFLTDYISSCQGLADYFIYCDTDGQANPDETRDRIAYLKNHVPVPIIMHCHNDRGNAVNNTLQGILAGADGVSSTFTGIGDRAGNAPTEEVIKRLKEDYGIVIEGFDYENLDGVSKLVKEYAKIGPTAPENPLSEIHEAGIHVDALLKARETGLTVYSHRPDGKINVCIGVSSGLSALRLVYEDIERPFPDEDKAKTILRELKDRALAERTSYLPPKVEEILVTAGHLRP